MSEPETIVVCPYCGQSMPLAIERGIASQQFVTDCEVCCRPMEIRVLCESGEILSLDVRAD